MKQNEQFSEVIEMIKQAKERALRAVNKEMIDLYWHIGEYVSKKVEAEDWGKSVVSKLAGHISKTEPDLKGFSDKNLWRMKQFFETYRDLPKLSAMMREISWTSNLAIMSGAKSEEEKEFYMRLSIRERYNYRELERQINSGAFERVMIGNQKLSATLREFNPGVINSFKDSYILEFLNLPPEHNESQLQKALLNKMKDFILELGKDFSFVGEEYRVQVGNSDFWIDLLFFHRGLQCLVAIELKADKFNPGFLGQLNFYLEALNRDVKKKNENPSIGILLCRYKDDEVVEYALSSSMSPALVAAYQTQLPDKKLLQQKLRELFEEKERSE